MYYIFFIAMPTINGALLLNFEVYENSQDDEIAVNYNLKVWNKNYFSNTTC